MVEYSKEFKDAIHSKLRERRDRLVNRVVENFGVPALKVHELMHNWFESERKFEEGGDWDWYNERVEGMLGKHIGDKETLSAGGMMSLGELLDGIQELEDAMDNIKGERIDIRKLYELMKKHDFSEAELAELNNQHQT